MSALEKWLEHFYADEDDARVLIASLDDPERLSQIAQSKREQQHGLSERLRASLAADGATPDQIEEITDSLLVTQEDYEEAARDEATFLKQNFQGDNHHDSWCICPDAPYRPNCPGCFIGRLCEEVVEGDSEKQHRAFDALAEMVDITRQIVRHEQAQRLAASCQGEGRHHD